MNEFEIDGLKIGDNHPPVVIAEIGINHNGSIDEAKKIAKCSIHFEINDMQISEDLQLIVGHLCMQWLNSQQIKFKS